MDPAKQYIIKEGSSFVFVIVIKPLSKSSYIKFLSFKILLN